MYKKFIDVLTEKLSKIENVKECYLISDPSDVSVVTFLKEDDKDSYFEVYDINRFLLDKFPHISFDNYVTALSKNLIGLEDATKLI